MVARRDLLERRLVRDSKHERDSTQLSLALKTDKRGQEPGLWGDNLVLSQAGKFVLIS